MACCLRINAYPFHNSARLVTSAPKRFRAERCDTLRFSPHTALNEIKHLSSMPSRLNSILSITTRGRTVRFFSHTALHTTTHTYSIPLPFSSHPYQTNAHLYASVPIQVRAFHFSFIPKLHSTYPYFTLAIPFNSVSVRAHSIPLLNDSLPITSLPLQNQPSQMLFFYSISVSSYSN